MAQTSEKWRSDNDDMVGVIWQTKEVNVKISRRNDGSSDPVLAGNGIYYAALTGAKVINLSWAFRKLLGKNLAANFAEAKGAVVVCGLPNEQQIGILYP